MNLASLLARAADRAGDGPALVQPGPPRTSVTYSAMDAEANRVAAWLQSQKVQPGDRVAVGMHNVPHFAYAYWGILRAGAVVVPLNVMLSEVETQRILVDCEAKAILTAPPFEEVVGSAAAGMAESPVIMSTSQWDSLGPLGRRVEEAVVDDNDLAVLAYTSGTTGEPKGAMLSHANLFANLNQQMEVPEAVAPGDILFLALPLFHIFGLNVTLGLLVMNAATGVLIDRFEPIAALRVIQDEGITVLFGAPPMYTAWVNTPGGEQYDLSSVRLAVSGAAPLPASVLTSFREIFGLDIWEGYGLTETAPTLTSNRMGPAPRANSIGLPLPHVELRLVDEEGMRVELGDTGEIVVRGPNVFHGYWRREEESRRAFLEDGWFRTGDIAVQDEDGYLYLVDRKRDLIIVSGFNVFPSEVENALLQNPKVAEAAVVGVSHPYTGEAVKAYVVLKSAAVADASELAADIQTRLARFKCPESIEVVDELPHLLSGKVLKRALREGAA